MCVSTNDRASYFDYLIQFEAQFEFRVYIKDLFEDQSAEEPPAPALAVLPAPRLEPDPIVRHWLSAIAAATTVSGGFQGDPGAE